MRPLRSRLRSTGGWPPRSSRWPRQWRRASGSSTGGRGTGATAGWMHLISQDDATSCSESVPEADAGCVHAPGDLLDQPEYRFWFLLGDGVPFFAVEPSAGRLFIWRDSFRRHGARRRPSEKGGRGRRGGLWGAGDAVAPLPPVNGSLRRVPGVSGGRSPSATAGREDAKYVARPEPDRALVEQPVGLGLVSARH